MRLLVVTIIGASLVALTSSFFLQERERSEFPVRSDDGKSILIFACEVRSGAEEAKARALAAHAYLEPKLRESAEQLAANVVQALEHKRSPSDLEEEISKTKVAGAKYIAEAKRDFGCEYIRDEPISE